MLSKESERTSFKARNCRFGKNLPPTSEKIVTTKVRTKSAQPIIIGGLLQVEESEMTKKIPGLGDIPIAGHLFKDSTTNETITEMVIYIIPYLHKKEEPETTAKRIEYLYNKYVVTEP